MKLVFFGLVGLGSTCLETLIKNKFDVRLVITEQTLPNNLLLSELKTVDNIRKKTFEEYIKYNYITDLCKKENIEYYYSTNINDDNNAYEKIKAIQPDVIVVSTYESIICEKIYKLADLSINIHPAILPFYAGPSPSVWAIRNNENKAGITVHKLNNIFDSGDIVNQTIFDVFYYDTGSSIYEKILEIYAPEILLKTLNQYKLGEIQSKPQSSKISYYPKYNLTFSEIKFEKMKASEIINIVRAGNFYFPAWFKINKKIFIIWEANIVYEDMEGLPGEAVKVIPGTCVIIKTIENSVALNVIQKNDNFSSAVTGDKILNYI
jgi:methionyl-tRNA formyltransferase